MAQPDIELRQRGSEFRLVSETVAGPGPGIVKPRSKPGFKKPAYPSGASLNYVMGYWGGWEYVAPLGKEPTRVGNQRPPPMLTLTLNPKP